MSEKLAEKLMERLTGIETRTVVMGHLQRGGSPSSFDRILGTGLGTFAVDMAARGKFGHMAGVKNNNFVQVPLSVVAKGTKTVPLGHNLIRSARSVGTCFGDLKLVN
ncbi:MAG: hypothetical protein COS99_03825 [Candidatus Omnitrophica bacterium CG07_land_8_20_14_0_80_42_15]|uniref:Phosphofructokinase domain-containing protein n=1 Tax=Candidatus Aquitaenariimonas noxiae TaxID=1974741 RepID=A0A2J0KVF1_9BACT|nr:MAG: hypothetical protein COS99_03825 [Candidatus Omnitrophica bacterium CG07_land_8_20_14_0_80_42_15]